MKGKVKMGNFIDLAGKRFERLVVIERTSAPSHLENKSSAYWLCRCDCGKIRTINGSSLRSGKTRSCGCLRADIVRKLNFVDMTNQKFGRLQVISLDRFGKEGSIWLCRCDCGKEVVVSKHSLNTENTKSCGCYGDEVRLNNIKETKFKPKEAGVAAFNNLYYGYKKRSKTRGKDFELTKEEFKILTKRECFYCGKPPSQRFGRDHYNQAYVYNGIDRLDNNIGYILENCVSCCSQCNFAKHSVSYDDFLIWVKVVYDNLKNKNIL